MSCDAHVVVARLLLCLSPGLVASARWWNPCLMAVAWESGEHSAVLTQGLLQESLDGHSW